ncbi:MULTISPECIES: sensor domain-containing protein [Thermocrispum]|jgi:hypothetical protein|uniref:Sensor domain-containing protein n=1 Tax=Thermocrispum agreste TaxID=37925 RepID=A0A2W4L6F4_9PSEU|nr:MULTISPECIES: sensor domain-containing protein [Thermocrispum]PZM96539.1 MAG: two-component system sensor kinase [Thermocrispum agreste]HLU95517.1 sensor domain-containing protein [Thermobifida alba]
MNPTAVTNRIDDAGRTVTRIEYDGSRSRPPVLGALVYLLLNFPLGIAWFAGLVTLLSLGVSTAIVWVGIGVLAMTMLLWSAGAQLERRRAEALLGTVIADGRRVLPDRPLKQRWQERLRDPQSWRDLLYLFALLPLGIVEFILLLVPWALGLGFATLPIQVRWLPGEPWYFPSSDLPWIEVGSAFEAMPWAALGLVLLVFAARYTQWLAGVHARYARWLLGPRPHGAVAGSSA